MKVLEKNDIRDVGSTADFADFFADFFILLLFFDSSKNLR